MNQRVVKTVKLLICILLIVCAALLGTIVSSFLSPSDKQAHSSETVTEEKHLDEDDLIFKQEGTLSSSMYTYEDMMADLKTLEDVYGHLMSMKTLDQTYDGRDIVDVIIGNEKSDHHVIIQYSIHAREYINTMICMNQLYSYLKGYNSETYKEQSYPELFSQVCFHILPMSNPDGVTISQKGLKGIKSKKLKKILKKCYQDDHGTGGVNQLTTYWKQWKANARGVDLNRNFDSGWKSYQGTKHPSSAKYKGTSPASEVETQAILSLVDDYPIVGCISCHSAYNVVFYDYGSKGSIYKKDKALADLVSQITGYSLKSSVSSSQDAAGCSDYFVLELKIPAVTIENGIGTCPLSFDQLEVLDQNNEDLWPALALHFQPD